MRRGELQIEIDLECGPGVTCVMGPSGSGKSTLLSVLAGLTLPDRGTVSLGGQTWLDRANGIDVPVRNRRISYMFQGLALFPHMTAQNNVEYGMHDLERGARAARAIKLLERLGVAHLANRRPRTFSGGEAQRVALARAIAPVPRLMLLDEPFSALDAGLRANMREMVKRRLTEEGVTGILVTHDQQEALSFADQLAVLEDGKVVQAGSPRELYLQPRTEMLAKFLGDALLIDGRVESGETETPLGRVRVGRATADGEVRVMLRPEQIRLVSWSEGTPTAEIMASSFEGPVTVVTFRAAGRVFVLKVPSADAPVQGRASIVLIGTGHVLPR